MSDRRALCETYAAGDSVFGNRLDLGGYLAAVMCGALPRRSTADHRDVRRGYAAGFGQWLFFEAKEPALACGRAARMSLDVHGYGVYEAACEQVDCLQHGTERVLLVGRSVLDEKDEVETLKRFVQAIKEHPWSSHWNPPTGYMTDYNNGQAARTGMRSLPL